MQAQIGLGIEELWIFFFFVAYRRMLIYKQLKNNDKGVIHFNRWRALLIKIISKKIEEGRLWLKQNALW